jgi:hypothetical protein
MPSETGEVTAVSRKGPKFGFVIEDTWYNGYGKCDLERGDTVKVEYDPNGKFRNVKSFEKIKSAEKPKPSPTPKPKRDDLLTEDIHLQVCLKATATIHAGSKATPQEIATYAKELMTELWA